MNFLMITIAWPDQGNQNIYSDLAEEFSEHGHHVTVAAIGARQSSKQAVLQQNHIRILNIPSGKLQKTNKYLKVIYSFLAGPKLIYYMLKDMKKEKFDCIIFTTPPITLTPFVYLLKKWYRAKLYLLLKDIWPQDCVDLGAMRKGGIVWSCFRILERMTYQSANYIGCMSEANVRYVREHYPYLKNKTIEECPNSERIISECEWDEGIKEEVRDRYQIPKDQLILVYGGNLGKAQGVEFLLKILQNALEKKDIYVLIIGDGTEFQFLEMEIREKYQSVCSIRHWIEKKAFLEIVKACDAGLIFLSNKNTVPNFPSRLLTYLQAKIPVIACIDQATDIGAIIERNQCGYQVISGDVEAFDQAVKKLAAANRKELGENGYQLFLQNYTTQKSYEVIIRHCNSDKQAEIKTIYRKYRKCRSFFRSKLYSLMNFICYGDLPTEFYIKRGMKIGKNFNRQSATKFDPSHCFLIEIGENVTIANHVQILAHDDAPRAFLQCGKIAKVSIGSHTFIGAGSLILPGVTIGEHAIIGAGSVVTHNIPDECVAAGVPAKVIGNIQEYVSKNKKELEKSRLFGKELFNGKKITAVKQMEIRRACSKGFAYVNLGAVKEYGRRVQK